MNESAQIPVLSGRNILSNTNSIVGPLARHADQTSDALVANRWHWRNFTPASGAGLKIDASAGAVVMTADDFAIFLKALFTGRLFKNKQTLEMMMSIPPAGNSALGKGMNYGHGMLNNNGVLGHGGQTLGFQSDGGYIPARDITFVMWANSATNSVNRLIVPGIAEILTAQQ